MYLSICVIKFYFKFTSIEKGNFDPISDLLFYFASLRQDCRHFLKCFFLELVAWNKIKYYTFWNSLWIWIFTFQDCPLWTVPSLLMYNLVFWILSEMATEMMGGWNPAKNWPAKSYSWWDSNIFKKRIPKWLPQWKEDEEKFSCLFFFSGWDVSGFQRIPTMLFWFELKCQFTDLDSG